MKCFRPQRLCCGFLLICLALSGQTAQPPATTDEVKYFRFVLMNLASLDYSLDAISAYQAALRSQHGLDDQEMAALNGASGTLHSLLQQIRQSSAQILASKTTLAPVDISTLQSLGAEREQLIVVLANQLLNSVRPQVADSLRTASHIVAGAVKSGQGGK